MGIGTKFRPWLLAVFAVALLHEGCVAEPGLDYTESELNEVNVEDEGTTTYVPSSVPTIELDNNDLIAGNPVTEFDCICEWNVWHTTDGFVCLGVECNDACTPETRACREQRVCQPM